MNATHVPAPSASSPIADDPGGHGKILFASAHSVVDSSNGAAVATLDALRGLAGDGFACEAFCTARLDFPGDVRIEEALADWGYARRGDAGEDRSAPGRVLQLRRDRVPITIVRVGSTRHVDPPPEEVRSVLDRFRTRLDAGPPDVMLTYGGDPLTQGMIALARDRGIPVVFAIHNFAYTDRTPFRDVDLCLVPSAFAMRYYRDVLGLVCRVLPYWIDWDRVRIDDRGPRFVTFVNPTPEKGVFPFVRIAHELGRRRPDIPMLVVEGRGTRATLAAAGLGREAAVNVQVMANTADPRRFWRLTRIALMPSLWWESQGLVAVEAMINGIPVIASDRGALPETLGDAGIVLPLPDRITCASRIEPTAEEVEPWVESIIRLWDDRRAYEEQGLRGRDEARRWHPDRLRPLYADFFRSVGHRTGRGQARAETRDTPGSMARRCPEGG